MPVSTHVTICVLSRMFGCKRCPKKLCNAFASFPCTPHVSSITYPKVDVQIPTTPEFSVADLECDRHLVILVQHLMEALARVRFHLNVVRIAEGKQGCEEEQKCSELHHDGRESADWSMSLVIEVRSSFVSKMHRWRVWKAEMIREWYSWQQGVNLTSQQACVATFNVLILLQLLLAQRAECDLFRHQLRQ